jgi:PKD repeat protein
LSSIQLDATASVPGTFVYSPAEGTVLGVGKQTLHVDLTPEDATNYTSASKEVEINVLNSSYSIFKSVIAPDESGDCIINSPGDKIPYRIVVKNDGNVDLTGVSVNDPMVKLTEPTGDDIDPGVLNPEEVWVYTGNYRLTQDDIDNGKGSIDNTATVSCNELPDKTSSVRVPIEQNSKLQIYTSVTGIDEHGDKIINTPGDVINYQVAVKNDGKVDLTGVKVSDPMIELTEPTGDDKDPGVLNPGEVWVYNGDYSVTQDDIDNNGDGSGFIENTATVNCDQLPSESSSMVLSISYAPLITVTPEPDNSKVTPVANFSTNITSGYAPLSVQFTDSSQNATSRSWDFNNDGMADSSDASPVYTYTAPGTYIANLNVSKGSLTDSKMTTITVLKATSSSSDSSGSSGSSGSSSGESNHIGGGTGHAVVVSSSEVNSSTGKTNTTGTATVIQSQNSTLAPKQSNENTAAKTEQKSEQKNNTNVSAKESKSTPGFEIVCGMTAMLAVYLYRRK